jgi:hypothetical protein
MKLRQEDINPSIENERLSLCHIIEKSITSIDKNDISEITNDSREEEKHNIQNKTVDIRDEVSLGENFDNNDEDDIKDINH